jgi:N-acetylated-alpha-linked acidic dipeptidase
VDLGPLREAAAALSAAGRAWAAARDARLGARDGGEPRLDAARARDVNAQLIGLEKAFLHMDGLQGRAWSRSLYASPDPFSGYAAWMLPGLRFEVETRDAEGVRRWVQIYLEAARELERRVRAAAATLQ